MSKAARRYVVLGAGAVGGAIGFGLARAGRHVVLVARGEHGRFAWPPKPPARAA